MPRLVVKKHHPLKVGLAVVIFSSFFSIGVWSFLDASHWRYIKDRMLKNHNLSKIVQLNESLEMENKQLKGELVMLQRANQIDNQVMIKLQKQIKNMQDERYNLKGELEFYQSVMASTIDSQGLSIQGLHIEPTIEKQLYYFKLVLTNVKKNGKVVKAVIRISIEGKDKTGSKTLPIDQLIAGDPLESGISFKSFKRIEGSINLPDGFKPLRVVVDLKQVSKKKSSIQRIFDWPEMRG